MRARRVRIRHKNVPSQTGEIGDLGASFARFLIWSSDFPRRASCSLTNFAFARLCWGVWAWSRGLALRPNFPRSTRMHHGQGGVQGTTYHCVWKRGEGE